MDYFDLAKRLIRKHAQFYDKSVQDNAMKYIIRDGRVIQMSSCPGCIAFEGTDAECKEYVKANGELYQSPLCPLCGNPSNSGAWFSNSNGKGQVCFYCRDK